MGEWKNAKLTDIAEYINGFAFKPSDFSESGIPIIRIEQLKNSNGYFDYFDGNIPERNWIENGDLIFSWSASLFLKIWQNNSAYLNQHLFKVIAKEGVDKFFLKYLLESSIESLLKMSHGSTMQHITRKELKKFEVKLPSEISEQTTIATILTTIDQAIEKTEQLITKYERIKTGLMQDLLTRGIDEQGNIRSEETHEFKVSALGRIPKEWEIYNLNSICTDIVDCPHSTPEYLKGGTLVARTMHIKNGQYDIQNSSFVSEEEYYDRIHRLEPQPGDIIFTREAPVGEAFIIPQGMKICLGQRVMQLRTNLEYCIPEFLLELIYFQKTRLRFDAIVGGTTNPHLNVSDVKKFNFPFPEPQEQSRICKSLNEFRKLIQKENDALNKLKRIKTALMQDLLTGKVRVDNLLNNKKVV